MPRIAHIADVHIRGLARHDEFKRTFDAFYEDCILKSIEHVFIGGDTFHTKTNISPEYVDVLVQWLTKLSTIVEVHMILGNHDLNLSNQSRQDAISPILSAMNNSKVHLYKKSGVYQFAPGFNWCVFSLSDKLGWKNVKPVSGEVNIACYHGSVRGALTESDWAIEGEIESSFFDEYSFVFLGDIHRTQYLAHRDVDILINESDLSKYPGAQVLMQ